MVRLICNSLYCIINYCYNKNIPIIELTGIIIQIYKYYPFCYQTKSLYNLRICKKNINENIENNVHIVWYGILYL